MEESSKEPLPDVSLPTGYACQTHEILNAGSLVWVVATEAELEAVEESRLARRDELLEHPAPDWRKSYGRYWEPGTEIKMTIDVSPNIGVEQAGAIAGDLFSEPGHPRSILVCVKLTPQAKTELSGVEVWMVSKLQVDPTFHMENPPTYIVEDKEAELAKLRCKDSDIARIKISEDATARFMGWRAGTMLRAELPHVDMESIVQYRIVDP